MIVHFNRLCLGHARFTACVCIFCIWLQIPCEHVFCLTCAKLDPTCFLCEERVTRIQKMDVLEGIFICGAPGCLRSFLARPDFDNHISDAHSQLLQLEQGRLSPERNISAGNPVPEAQAQSHQGGQQYADLGPPMRQSSGTLQVLLPKKEEQPQRRPPKSVRQDPQGVLARPVPELRLPDQFPRHRGGDQHSNQSNYDIGNDMERHEPRRDRKPRRHSEWDTQVPQGQGENEREYMHEGEPQRERRGDGSSGRTKERDGDKGSHPSSIPAPKDPSQQLASLPPPPPYPPPNFSTAYPPQQEGNTTFPSRFDASRAFHPGMPLPSRPEGFNQNGPPRPPLDGYGQSGGPPRPMNGQAAQDQFGHNRSLRPHFYPEYGPGPVMGMPPMGAPRYHEGHLPPPPPGPPPKRAKFNGPQGSGEPMMEPYSWGPGNPANFGGPPGGHANYGGPQNWMPPANS
ncbi:hypothetical protein M758_12G150600 [Ceratodon purpureus]|nr:hypothetical protein M758_12G150600 [Ceratodon purpureus]